MNKLFAILFIFCLTANIAFAAPNYDPNKKWVNYDMSYNVALRNHLEEQFEKKHFLYEEDKGNGYTIRHYDTMPGDYAREVEVPYNHLKINTNPNYY